MYDENNEAKTKGDIVFSGYRKFSNFMYHYKAIILLTIAALAVGIVAVAQCAMRVEPDVHIVYAGPKLFDLHEMNTMRAAFHTIIGEDLNNDGRIYAGITRFNFMTDVQVEEARARHEIVNINNVRIAQQQLGLEFVTGQNFIFFLSPEAYRAVRRTGNINNFMFIDMALGYELPPEMLFDEEGLAIRLSELPIFEYFEGIGAFPPDTLLAFRDHRIEDNTNATILARHDNNLKIFRRLVEFTPPEEENH